MKSDHKNEIVMDIQLVSSDEAIAACYPVMRELRPHLGEEAFVAQVGAMAAAGYRLAARHGAAGVVAVAGFRLGENLAWGRYLYVDDLVTLPAQRSQGHGSALLAWLCDYARDQGCGQLHLDSGVQREAAHRFYEREGMAKAGYHFVRQLG